MPRGFWRSQGESIRTEEDKDSFDRLFLGGFVFVEKGVSDLEILGVAQSCGFLLAGPCRRSNCRDSLARSLRRDARMGLCWQISNGREAANGPTCFLGK
jgi:hypothetical protein